MKSFEQGQHLGAYEIIRPLDAGGMGMVYEAKHSTLGTHCAIKVFVAASQQKEFLRKRFLAEGKLLAEFRHPNIVRVTDLQIDEVSGAPYFAMDLVLSPSGEPRTLEAARKSGVDEELVAGWLRDICEGLAYIHGKGVVHRDISLENVLIGPDGHAVITDFGISRIFNDSLRQRVDLTRVTRVELGAGEFKMGKAPYMAPELTRPLPAFASPASDAWALGILVFRLLTGFWFERERRENALEMLSGMTYDWAAVFARLLNDRPAMRIPPDGIAAIPKLLTPQKVPSTRKRVFIMSALAILASAAVIASIIIFSSRKNSVPPTRHAAPGHDATNATLRVEQTIDPSVLSDLENAIIAPTDKSEKDRGK